MRFPPITISLIFICQAAAGGHINDEQPGDSFGSLAHVALPVLVAAVVVGDLDADGVVDTGDRCADSLSGYPVREDGCPVLQGVLRGVNFKPETVELTTESFEQLFYLANLLKKYPVAKIRLLAHSDNTGTLKEQSMLTRGRLRAIGTYLLQQGIKANRLVLRSLGGSAPAYDNSTVEGRARNNRIEVREQQ